MKKYILLLVLTLLCGSLLMSQTVVQKIDKLVKHYVDHQMFNGALLVAEKGNVIYKGGFGMANVEWGIPNTTTTKFRIGSISKQFTSMLIMQLVNEGKITLDAPITLYLPHYRRDTGDNISIHQLLTHSSGLPNYTDNDNFYKGDNRQFFTVEDFVRLYCSGDLEFEPGSQFNYSNSGYYVLGAIIEAVTKQPYEKRLQEKILDPLGMKNTGYDHSEAIIPNRAAGYEITLDGFKNAEYIDMSLPYAAGSLYSTVEDLLIWDRALYTEKLLPETMKKKMFTQSVDAGNSFGNGNFHAAYGWFIQDKKIPNTDKTVPSIWHSGGINGFGSYIIRYPNTEHVFIAMDNTAQYNQEQMADWVYGILTGENYVTPKKPFAHTIKNKIKNEGVDAAYDFHKALDKAQKEQYDFNEAERSINQVGYILLNEKKDAVGASKIFEININEFPQSSNVYDSYGESLMALGNYPLAIENYRKSFALDSSNTRALRMIDIMKRTDSEQKTDTITVRVDGHRMNLYKTGNKGPVVVLEAGGNSNHECWNSIVPELSKKYIVITYDRPGYLASVSCSKPRTANRVAEELKEALNTAGIKGPYIIGGWSWGGAFARAFAAKYPSETKGLLLVDPAFKEVYDKMAAQYPDEYTRIFSERISISRAADEEFDAMMATMLQAGLSDEKFKGKIELLIAGSDKEWKDFEKPLKQIWVNELIHWAKKNENTKYQVVDSGHAIQFEKPDTVINAISELAK